MLFIAKGGTGIDFLKVLNKKNTVYIFIALLCAGVTVASAVLISGDDSLIDSHNAKTLDYTVQDNQSREYSYSTCDSPDDSSDRLLSDSDTELAVKELNSEKKLENLSLFLDDDSTPDKIMSEQNNALEKKKKTTETRSQSASDTDSAKVRSNSRTTTAAPDTDTAKSRTTSRTTPSARTAAAPDTDTARSRTNSGTTPSARTAAAPDTDTARSRTNNSTSFAASSTPAADDTKTKYTPLKLDKYHFDMQHYCQLQEMPTGCEIVSTRAVLEYYGISLTYQDMMKHISTAQLKSTKDGKLYSKSPYQAFIGDPTKYSGFGCYPSVITEMIENYHFDDLYVENTCNKSLDYLAKTYVTRDIPVLVWATIGMGQSYLTSTWFVEDDNGKPTKQKYTWRANEHCLVLLGYDKNYYYFNDPMSTSKVTKYDKSLVEKRYKEVGSNSLVILEYE